jgi:hypothetical protein
MLDNLDLLLHEFYQFLTHTYGRSVIRADQPVQQARPVNGPHVLRLVEIEVEVELGTMNVVTVRVVLVVYSWRTHQMMSEVDA